MIEIVSKNSRSNETIPVTAAETMYVSATLGSSFRSFAGEVLAAVVSFEALPSEECFCRIDVETRGSSIETEARGSCRSIAFARAAEELDRRLFGAIYGPRRRAA